MNWTLYVQAQEAENQDERESKGAATYVAQITWILGASNN